MADGLFVGGRHY